MCFSAIDLSWDFCITVKMGVGTAIRYSFEECLLLILKASFGLGERRRHFVHSASRFSFSGSDWREVRDRGCQW